MRSVLLASLRVHARRYVAAVVAVTIAVGFVVTTNALTSSATSGMLAELGETYQGVDTVVSGLHDARDADRTLRTLEAEQITAAVNAFAYVPVRLDGALLGDQTDVAALPAATELRWQRATTGELPARAGQVAVDAHVAQVHQVGVGDTLVLGGGEQTVSARVTGLVESRSGPHAGSAYLSWADVLTLRSAVMPIDLVVADADRARVEAVLVDRFLVETVEEHLVALQSQLTRDVDITGLMLLVFAAIAAFVAVLVIANTFAVLLAQRARDFALLRCVGATRRQLLRSLRGEALVIGAGAATLGVVAGAGFGYAVVAVAGRLLPEVPLGPVSLSPLWLVAAWLLGVAVTVGASLLPAHRGTRVSPLAALRAAAPVSMRSRTGGIRITLALLALGGGAALMALAMQRHEVVPMLAGGFVSFLGVILLAPLLVPAAIRLAGRALERVGGVPGRLTAANAVRNPRRTAATATSLLLGVTLVTAMVVGMATVRATVEEELDVEYPVDATLTVATRPLGADVAAQVAAMPGVTEARSLRGAAVAVTAPGGRVLVERQPVVGAAAGLDGVTRGSPAFLTPEPGTVHLPTDVMSEAGIAEREPVVLAGPSGPVRFRAVSAAGTGGTALIAPQELRRLAGGPGGWSAWSVWLRVGDGADAADLGGRLTALARVGGATLDGGLSNRAVIDRQLDIVLGTVLVLLGVGVLIALVGVGSTLGLSVLERTREHALLRAMGLTRRQLRLTLTAEAVLIAGVAGLLGAGLGTAYAWVGAETLIGVAVAEVSVVMPWAQVALVAALAGLAGVAAGVLPSRRAARITPAAGLTAD